MKSENNNFEVMVSVCCTAFNHANYIADALEGFIKQNVDFPIEILVHDDASTDGTQDVILEYEKRYPHLIKAICQKNNQYLQGRYAFAHILYPMARGKYIAFCDGDDYWTDPLKLKKQVEFLENNPDYVICGHDAYIINEFGIVSNSKLPDVHKRDAVSRKLQKNRDILALSICFRNLRVPIPEEYSNVMNGDAFLFSWLGNFGHYKYMDDIKPGAYRVHAGGMWSLLDMKEKKVNSMITYYWLAQYYKRIGSHDIAFYHLAQAVYIAVDELCILGVKRVLLLNCVLFKAMAQKSVPRSFAFLRSLRNRLFYKNDLIRKHEYH